MSSQPPNTLARSETEAPPGDSRLIAAVAATWTVSLFGYFAQAQMLSHLMTEYGQGEAAVGWLFSLENAALALTTMAAAGPLARVSRVRAAMAGAAVVLVANVASAFAGSWEMLLVLRWISGMGAGFVGAAGTGRGGLRARSRARIRRSDGRVGPRECR